MLSAFDAMKDCFPTDIATVKHHQSLVFQLLHVIGIECTN